MEPQERKARLDRTQMIAIDQGAVLVEYPDGAPYPPESLIARQLLELGCTRLFSAAERGLLKLLPGTITEVIWHYAEPPKNDTSGRS